MLVLFLKTKCFVLAVVAQDNAVYRHGRYGGIDESANLALVPPPRPKKFFGHWPQKCPPVHILAVPYCSGSTIVEFMHVILPHMTADEFKAAWEHSLKSPFNQETREVDVSSRPMFFLELDDNRRMAKTSDDFLAKSVILGLEKWVEMVDIDFNPSSVKANVARVFFCNDLTSTSQQICVVCSQEGLMAQKVKKRLSEMVEDDGVRVLVGKNNMRFKVVSDKQVPHKKITIRVKEPELADNHEALILAMKVRLLGTGTKLLRADFKGKSNLFEFVLEGSVIPEALRKDIMLKTLGGFSLMMSFDGEPMPCVQCGVNTHTTKSCPVLEGKREKEKCWVCGKEGHIQIACPQRKNPRCHACGEEGHLKAWCPKVL